MMGRTIAVGSDGAAVNGGLISECAFKEVASSIAPDEDEAAVGNGSFLRFLPQPEADSNVVVSLELGNADSGA
jgi:hypothetical protein